jgi:hypothetical protein
MCESSHRREVRKPARGGEFAFVHSSNGGFFPWHARPASPRPRTEQQLNGYRVDFYWPDLKLVVETDGLTYHRTPAQQARIG